MAQQAPAAAFARHMITCNAGVHACSTLFCGGGDERFAAAHVCLRRAALHASCKKDLQKPLKVSSPILRVSASNSISGHSFDILVYYFTTTPHKMTFPSHGELQSPHSLAMHVCMHIPPCRVVLTTEFPAAHVSLCHAALHCRLHQAQHPSHWTCPPQGKLEHCSNLFLRHHQVVQKLLISIADIRMFCVSIM